MLPFELEGDPVQYQINRNTKGWVIELVNNDGVFKTGSQPAEVHEAAAINVRINPGSHIPPPWNG